MKNTKSFSTARTSRVVAAVASGSTALHATVVEQIGLRIVQGDFLPGEALPNADDSSEMLGVSRTVLREAIKVLAGKGLVESRPKTGTRVRPRSDWNFLDPDVLSWRYAAGVSAEDVTALFELRRATIRRGSATRCRCIARWPRRSPPAMEAARSRRFSSSSTMPRKTFAAASRTATGAVRSRDRERKTKAAVDSLVRR
ncbi:GntR family transcriptional regulator [Mesorhizobium sp.]|uniref:FadR/GntR family transcriptional regulator n=1 Tax=Mesorhizobium sp. TaxID=1871066 RepID=UPI0032AF7EEF